MKEKESNVQVLSLKKKKSIPAVHGRENDGFTMSADDKQVQLSCK